MKNKERSTRLASRLGAAGMVMALALGLLPQAGSQVTALADDSGSSEWLKPTSVVMDAEYLEPSNNKWDSSDNYLYYGTYNNTPMKYRIIYTQSDYIYVDSDSLITTMSHAKDGQKNTNQNEISCFANSYVKSWLNGDTFYKSSAFSDAERSRIGVYIKADKQYKKDNVTFKAYQTNYNTNDMTADTITFLSAEEADSFYENDAARKKSGAYYLRSAIDETKVGIVDANGSITASVYDAASTEALGVSPHFLIDTDGVCGSAFATAVGFDKTAAATYTKEADSKEWKMTVKDSDINFDVDDEAITRTVRDGQTTISIPYTYTEGKNKVTQISLCITQTSCEESIGNFLEKTVYYGKVDTASNGSGVATFTLPNDILENLDKELTEDDYGKLVSMMQSKDYEGLSNFKFPSTMYVIAESVNKGTATDYCAFSEAIELPEAVEVDTTVKEVDDGSASIGKGKVDVDTAEDSVEGSKLATSAADVIEILKDSGYLTETEQIDIALGKRNAEVELKVTDNDEAMNAEEENIIKAYADDKSLNIGKYLDITLTKYMVTNGVRDSEGTMIEELSNGNIAITVKIPDSIINSDSSINREYVIIRNHDGEVESITPTYNKDADTLTFETDRFSDYAIAYKDTKVEKKQPAASETTDTIKTTDSKTSDSNASDPKKVAATPTKSVKKAAKTNDTESTAVPAMVLLLGTAVIAASAIRRRKQM